MEHLVEFNVCRIVAKRDLTSFVSPEEHEAYILAAANLAGDQTNLTGFTAPVRPPATLGQSAVTIDPQKSQELADFPEHLRDKWRPLGSGFGHVYLGETFSCYTYCKNISQNENISNLSVRIELQLPSQRLITLGQITSPELAPMQSVGEALRHEVKELGVHLMILTISGQRSLITDQPSQSTALRRVYKFQVDKPLDVKTKFYNAESDEVYLEALLQNLTATAIRLDQVALEPSEYFQVAQLNYLKIENEDRWIFNPKNRFNPMESRQYLFCLTPKENHRSNVQLLKNVTTIGKLDIKWTSGLGEEGHLQTSQLERMPPQYGNIRLSVIAMPNVVIVKKPFQMTCRLTNCADKSLDLELHLENEASNQKLLWLGQSTVNLGPVEPNASVDFTLKLYSIGLGMQPIPKINVLDLNFRNGYDFDEISYAYVVKSMDEIPADKPGDLFAVKGL